jgi:hypothetical protein
MLNGPLAMQAYFQQRRDPCECAAQDGIFVAHMLFDAAETSSGGKDQTKQIVRNFALRTTMLHASGFPNLSEMLATAVSRSHVTDLDSASEHVSSETMADPASVTEKEATLMGAVFAGILDSGRTATPALGPGAAVLKFTEAFVPLSSFGRKHWHVWFVPMLTTIAERLQGTSVVDRSQRESMGRGMQSTLQKTVPPSTGA